MTDISKLPLELYEANLELQTRLGRLLQESSAQWIQYGQELAHEASDSFQAEFQELLNTKDPLQLATLSTASFWRHLERHFGNNQTLVQTALERQAHLAHEVQDAVSAWQERTSAVLTAGWTPNVLIDATAWGSLFRPWEQLLKASAQQATTKGKRSARKGSA